MSIKFPSMHIAESVINRIMNTADQLRDNAPPEAGPRPFMPQPSVPDTAAQSAQLDAALSAPPPDLPGLDQAPDAGATAAGKPMLATMLEPE